jgi:DNA-binding MarR family transcriptional regulator
VANEVHTATPAKSARRTQELPLRPALERTRVLAWALSSAERRLRARQEAGATISHPRLPVLIALVKSDDMTPGQLAREADVSPSTVTSIVDQLERQGLVRRRKDATDGRVSRLSLTPDGRAILAEHSREWDRRLSEAFDDIDDRDLDAANRVLERLIQAIEEA